MHSSHLSDSSDSDTAETLLYKKEVKEFSKEKKRLAVKRHRERKLTSHKETPKKQFYG